MLPLVSVIIPCYNCEKFVYDAINSIITQTYSNLEIIITDDCSTDNTLDIISAFAEKDKRIMLNKHAINRKLIDSLNEMIEMSHGKYIVRMDSDDVSLPDRIYKQVEFMENNMDVSVCGGNVFIIDENGKKIKDRILPSVSSEIKALMPFANVIVHPSVMVRTEILKRERYAREFIHAEDYELWNRLIYDRGLKIANINSTILYYRVTDNQVCQKYSLEQTQSTLKVIEKYNMVENENLKIHAKIFFEYDSWNLVSEEEKKYILKIYSEIKKYRKSFTCDVMTKVLIRMKANKRLFIKYAVTPLGIYTLFRAIKYKMRCGVRR